jgi:hypothetical protein
MSDFVAYEVIFKVNANATYEALLKYWIKSAADQQRLRQSKLEWSATGAKGLRQSTKFLRRGVERRKRAGPFASGAWTELHSPPEERNLGDRSGAKNQKVKLELSLFSIREIIADLAQALTELDNELVPYWCATNSAKASIRATHDISANGLLQFTASTAMDRQPHFERLLELAEQWGPIKIERTELNTVVKAYEREAKRIETELTAVRRKERAKQHE